MFILGYDDRDGALREALRAANVRGENTAIVQPEGEPDWLCGSYRALKRDHVGNETFRLVTHDGHVWRLS
jgi:hypothetical protein